MLTGTFVHMGGGTSHLFRAFPAPLLPNLHDAFPSGRLFRGPPVVPLFPFASDGPSCDDCHENCPGWRPETSKVFDKISGTDFENWTFSEQSGRYFARWSVYFTGARRCTQMPDFDGFLESGRGGQ